MSEQKLEKFTRILLYAVPFLALIFIEGFYFPFIITRTVYFRLIIQLVLSLYAILLVLNWEKYKPRWNLALGLAMIFLAVNFIAGIFGYDFYKSFWSDFERMEGIISLIYLTAYLFLLQAFFKTKEKWLFYIRLILISSLAVALYGLAQRFSILPVFEAGIGRVTSTLGNAAFLAGYLLLAAVLGVYYYFNETNKNYRYFALAAVVLNSLVLLMTSTRGAILGLAGGIFIFASLNTLFLKGSKRKYYLAAVLIILALGSSFFVFREKLAKSNSDTIRRMATISLSEGTARNRLIVWRMALKDFKFHPWLGAGMENFEVIFNKYFTPSISENWFDRTHNVYLDQLVSAGVFGLASYLAIMFYLFCRLFKKRREDYWQFAVLTSLLIAYAIHNFFVFDTINTAFLYFFLIGFISFKERGSASEPEIEPQLKKNQPALKNQLNAALAILIIFNLWAFYRLVYLPAKINRAIYVGYYYVIADTFRSYENFQYALSHKFGSVEAAVQLNKMLDVVENQSGASQSVKDKYYELDREKLKFASENFPLDIKTKMYLGQLLLNNSEDPNDLAQAEELFKETMKLSPARPESYYLLYNLYSKRGKKAEARAVLEDLMKKLPDYGGVKIMLMSDYAKEDPKKAEEFYQAAIKQHGYESFGGLTKILGYLISLKRYEETIPYYEKLLSSEADNYDYRLDLAQIYLLVKKPEEAKEQIDIIKAEAPDKLKGYENLLKALDNENEKLKSQSVK